MGVHSGPGARMARHIFTSLNHAFSPRRVRDTRDAFETWLKAEMRGQGSDMAPPLKEDELRRAVADGMFYQFMQAQGWVHPDDQGASAVHLRHLFEYGTYDIVGHAVIGNLFHRFSNVDGNAQLEDIFPEAAVFDDRNVLASDSVATHLAEFYPRPIAFEREFGDREEIVIRSNDYGMKIIVCTLADTDHIRRRRLARLLFRQEVGFLEDRQRTVVEYFIERLRAHEAANELDDGDRNSVMSTIIARIDQVFGNS